jgi:hypothetical protein
VKVVLLWKLEEERSLTKVTKCGMSTKDRTQILELLHTSLQLRMKTGEIWGMDGSMKSACVILHECNRDANKFSE